MVFWLSLSFPSLHPRLGPAPGSPLHDEPSLWNSKSFLIFFPLPHGAVRTPLWWRPLTVHLLLLATSAGLVRATAPMTYLGALGPSFPPLFSPLDRPCVFLFPSRPLKLPSSLLPPLSIPCFTRTLFQGETKWYAQRRPEQRPATEELERVRAERLGCLLLEGREEPM